MLTLALTLLAVGSADLVAGRLAGTPLDARRATQGLVTAVVICLVASPLLGLPSVEALGLLVLVGGGTALWLFGRLGAALSPWLPLTGLGVTLLGATLFSLDFATPPRLSAIVRHVLPDASERLGPLVLLLAGLGLVQAATANGIVRVLLQAAGTPFENSQQRLRGGRIIGFLERLLIFGLALSGQPAAAALVASAKSILRFPEISSLARPQGREGPRGSEVDEVTEYFLIGSLSSWAVALGGAAVFRLFALAP